jgi:hypothetical protein
MAYTNKYIAKELTKTALNQGYYGNALRVAKDYYFLTAYDRSILDKYATGRDDNDHIALQDIANRIANYTQ